MKLATIKTADGREVLGAADTGRGEILEVAHANEAILGTKEPAFASLLTLIEGLELTR